MPEIPLNVYFAERCDIAVALHMAGVPFAFPDRPAQNTYSLETLLRTEQKASDLHKRGIPGEVKWGFALDAAMPLLVAYKAERDAIKAGAATSELSAADPIDFIKIAAHYADVRREMLKLWQLVPSNVRDAEGNIKSMNSYD